MFDLAAYSTNKMGPHGLIESFPEIKTAVLYSVEASVCKEGKGGVLQIIQAENSRNGEFRPRSNSGLMKVLNTKYVQRVEARMEGSHQRRYQTP